MTITTAAADWIRDSLQRSDVPNPVVCLGHVCNTSAEITEALSRGANKKELQEITLRALESEPSYLYPLVYPRSHYLWIFTTTIQGFRFASLCFHPARARHAMKRGLLDVAERGLVLMDTDGTVVLPRQASRAL